MTPRERVRAVFEGRCPDQVPLMLDLSHWYKKNNGVPFDLAGFKGVEWDLVRLHQRLGAVSYVEMGSFYDLAPADPRVRLRAWTEGGVFRTEIATPQGRIHEERVFNPGSYSYGIRKHLLESVAEFPIVRRLMDCLVCQPRWERYLAWRDALGEVGFLYCPLPYSGLGYLISRYFGVEKTVYAVYDHPREVRLLVEAVNRCNLRILDAIADGPFDVLILSDNFDSTVQTAELFDAFSRDFYTEVARRLHRRGKYLAVHVDGEMRGALRLMAGCGVDCIDAATPAPMFRLSPAQARAEAGPGLILSGGIPATVFGAGGTDREFTGAVRRWLDTRRASSRLILAAGDQVPPDAPFDRIARLPELVEEYGRY